MHAGKLPLHLSFFSCSLNLSLVIHDLTLTLISYNLSLGVVDRHTVRCHLAGHACCLITLIYDILGQIVMYLSHCELLKLLTFYPTEQTNLSSSLFL